jgi:hypothetical protein
LNRKGNEQGGNKMLVIIVSCSAGKADKPAQAQDLYTGDLFKKQAELAKLMVASGVAKAWYILSAKHGLIDPTQIIEPYDVAMGDLTKQEMQALKRRVARQLPTPISAPHYRWADGVIALCGEKYRQVLSYYCDDIAIPLINLTPGMGIGSQKKWLKERIADYRRDAELVV